MRLFFPFYSTIDRRSLDYGPVDFLQDLEVRMGERTYRYSVVYTWLAGSSLQVYLIDCPELYHRAGVYTDDPDEAVRFGLLCRAALESTQRMGWSPDIVHCNDWHTAAIPVYLNTVYRELPLGRAASILTIHNMQYQGSFYGGLMDVLGVGWQHFNHLGLECDNQVNLLKGGLYHATLINAVSPGYAEEI